MSVRRNIHSVTSSAFGEIGRIYKNQNVLYLHIHTIQCFFIADTQDVIFMIQLFPNSLFPWLRAKRTKPKTSSEQKSQKVEFRAEKGSKL